VDSGYGAISTTDYGGIDAWTLAFLFGFQIYFDFAGYSHIAIGAARLCGVHFPENFNFPYASRTPKEFWKRWHISLSSWIRDYLYSPLCGLKGGTESRGGLGSAEPASEAGRRNRALLVTWAIMGLWHGANWTFLAWGLWHGTLVLLFRLAEKRFKLGEGSVLSWAVTLPLVMLGWVFFRAQTMADALKLVGAALNPLSFVPSGEGGLLARLHLALPPNAYLVTLALLLATMAAWWAHVRIIPALRQRGGVAHFASQVAVFTVVIGMTFIYFRPAQLFIYFQF
jgi:D-alanyl-lipoteichoic acid acyltransferase DltB (MBOAT superfamily)